MGMSQGPSSSMTAVGGTDAAGVSLTETRESLTAKREKNYTWRHWKEQGNLINAGYRVIEKWECDDIKTKEKQKTKKQTKTYPHAIFYDFESFHDSTKRKEATDYLTYENAHVPISVSIGDTIEREPTHICDPDAKELIRKFMEELKRRTAPPGLVLSWKMTESFQSGFQLSWRQRMPHTFCSAS